MTLLPYIYRITLTSAVIATLALAGCGQPESESQTSQERPVSITTVRFASEAKPRTFVGVVRARVESNLGFRISGKIAERLVDRGTIVKAGQPLATLDQTDSKLQLQQAQSALSSARATRDQALSERTRIAKLHKRGWSTNSDLDKVNSAADQATAAYDQATKAVTLAENTLSYTTLVADSDGVVTATQAEPGQVIAPGQAIIGLAHAAAREADVSIPETLVDSTRTNTATVKLWSRPDKLYQAKLRELSPSADPVTRTYPARFSIEGGGSEIDLGMTATVMLANDSAPVARLALGAILDTGNGPTVFVVDPSTRTLISRPVTVSSYGAEFASISHGLSEGETVIALGVQKLHAGETVKPISDAGS